MIVQRSPPLWVNITTAEFGVAGGAVGWIDTDISATVPAGSWVVFLVYCAAPQAAGVRPTGSGADSTVVMAAGIPLFIGIAQADATGHVELYRSAADNAYRVMGYWL